MKRYIGDGVYVDHDGLGLVVTTENGIRVTNRIVLEPQVWADLVQYVEDLRQRPAGVCSDPDCGLHALHEKVPR
jgi:hypothetical protein